MAADQVTEFLRRRDALAQDRDRREVKLSVMRMLEWEIRLRSYLERRFSPASGWLPAPGEPPEEAFVRAVASSDPLGCVETCLALHEHGAAFQAWVDQYAARAGIRCRDPGPDAEEHAAAVAAMLPKVIKFLETVFNDPSSAADLDEPG